MNIMSSKPIRIDTKYENIAVGKRYIDRKDLFNRKDGFIYINNVPLKYAIRLNRAFPIDIFNTIEWVHAEQMDAAAVEKIYNELVISKHDELKENHAEEKKEDVNPIIDEETEELINDVLDYAMEEDQVEDSDSSDEEEEDIDDNTEEELNSEHPHTNDQQFTFSSKRKRHRR